MLKIILLLLFSVSCGDDYVAYENRIIDCDNTWYPELTYYVYHLEEGEYDAYFHAYIITDDSVSRSGTKEIFLENGKKILGHYSGINTAFIPSEYISKAIPMAYVSVSYE